MWRPWPEREGRSRMEYVRVTCERFQRGEEEMELMAVSEQPKVKRFRWVSSTYYCLTRIGGSMERKEPIERAMEGYFSRRSRTETHLAQISVA
jgi:hypothetical protein